MKNTNTISQIKHGTLAALCLYLLSTLGCEVRPDSKLPEINDFIVDSVYLPISEMDRTKGRIREVGHGKFAPNEWIAFMNNNSMKLYFFDMTRQTYIDSISLVSYWNENPDFEATGVDSEYLNLNNNMLTRLFGNDKKEWYLNAITAAIGPKVYIGTVSAYPIVTFGDTVICTTTTSEGKKAVGPSIAFLKANHDIVLSIATDTPELLTKHNPNPSYFLVQDYDARAEKVYLNSREIMYSFSHSDTLVLCNLFTGAAKKTKLLTNDFLPNTPFDYSNASSMEYGTSYAMSNTRMGAGSLYFDSSQHRIYQLMKHRGRYIDEDGTKHDYNEIPKSLFVLDDRLNQLMEIYIPPNTFSSKFFSFITHKGLYFAAHPSKQKYHDKMLFYRIVVP